MKPIRLKGEQDTPTVILDKDTNEFLLKGSSMPEDVKEFYRPIMNWLDEYFQEPNENTTFIFEMVYFNTASSKIVLDIMYKLKDAIDSGINLNIIWRYFDDDEEMMEAGEDFSDIVEVDLKLECL